MNFFTILDSSDTAALILPYCKFAPMPLKSGTGIMDLYVLVLLDTILLNYA